MDANFSRPVDPAAHRVLAGVSRVQVLEVLRAQAAALTVAAVAEQVGLHPNTVRLHLDQLVEAGLVAREPEPRDRPGRPRWVYAATSSTEAREAGGHDADGQDGYRLLAEILASHLEGTAVHAAAGATAAGQSWGRRWGTPPKRTSTPMSAGQATDHVVQLMDELGFAPRSTGLKNPIELHHCPFRQVAEKHSPVVCGVHLGLMQGALAQLTSPVRATVLEPFVAPGLCLAHLSTEGAGDA